MQLLGETLVDRAEVRVRGIGKGLKGQDGLPDREGQGSGLRFNILPVEDVVARELFAHIGDDLHRPVIGGKDSLKPLEHLANSHAFPALAGTSAQPGQDEFTPLFAKSHATP